jgi:hypothetical protein
MKATGKTKKPLGERLVGLGMVVGSMVWIARSLQGFPAHVSGLYFAIPLLIIGLIVLLIKDATKSGDVIFESLSRLFR